MFARFDENPAMTLRVIKETKRYGRTDGRTDARMDNVKTVYPLQTKFMGGIKTKMIHKRSNALEWPVMTSLEHHLGTASNNIIGGRKHV